MMTLSSGAIRLGLATSLLYAFQPILARETGARPDAVARYRSSLAVDPQVLLQTVYSNFIMLRRCYEAREGNLAIFIDDAELGRATAEVRGLKQRIALLAPSVDDDTAWRRANDQIAPFSQNMQNCRGALAFLDRTYQN